VPIDHVKLPISDLDASRAFDAAIPLDPDGHDIEAVFHGPGDRR
jgi:hypothetical protein